MIDPASGVRVRYQVVVADPFPRMSVGAGGCFLRVRDLLRARRYSSAFSSSPGPFNNSDSSNAWGTNHSVDAIFRLDTGLVGNVRYAAARCACRCL